jgi:hypothetical protein
MPKGHSKHRILLFPRFGRAGKRLSVILLSYHHQKIGGGGRDRTDDLRLAKPALSQLSYAPADTTVQKHNQIRRMVGLGRFELPTSRLSSARSNQLSYRPLTTDQKHLQVPPKNRQTKCWRDHQNRAKNSALIAPEPGRDTKTATRGY